ncbi:MAG: MBL fold metallo-hydrolase [Rhodobacteraceae bacterium]|nr:MBL fold metallo-hydrolase [Paracoccaceae bacterium]
MDRREFLKSASAALAATTGLQVVQLNAQSLSGAQSFTIGDIKITALLDGFLPIEASAMFGITPEEFAAQLQTAFLSGPAHPTGVNAFLIETGDRRVLVDAGTGAAFGPTLGQLSESLSAHGIDPASIDTVFATHLHPDHIGGILTEAGNPFSEAGLMVHPADIDFWNNDEFKAAAPAEFQGFFDMARGAVAAFGDKVQSVEDGAEIAPGLTLMHLPGHTMGHSGLMLESNGAQLLIAGDVVHVPPVQFAMPAVTIGFDTDQDMARQTRMRVFDMVSSDAVPIAGAHIGFPGLGHLVAEGDGYRFEPMLWQFG